jgi:hypothetical protein
MKNERSFIDAKPTERKGRWWRKVLAKSSVKTIATLLAYEADMTTPSQALFDLLEHSGNTFEGVYSQSVNRVDKEIAALVCPVRARCFKENAVFRFRHDGVVSRREKDQRILAGTRAIPSGIRSYPQPASCVCASVRRRPATVWPPVENPRADPYSSHHSGHRSPFRQPR